MPAPKLRLATSNGQREPDWRLTLEQNPLYAPWVAQMQEIWRARERPAPPPRTPAPNRRLLLVVSQSQPPDELDREWEPAEATFPECRHWVVQIKHGIREKRWQSFQLSTEQSPQWSPEEEHDNTE